MTTEEVKQLRLGNLVINNYNPDQIIAIDTKTFADIFRHPQRYLFVEITEYWLIKAGFNKHVSTGIVGFEYSDPINNTYYFTKNRFTVVQWGINTPYYFSSNLLRVELKYVHNLQNLFMDLTGKELTL